ncbi:hypothetical protein [Enterococcus xiangfangensis]|uniref:hypothetical protein n=1 Tax=Enterococcus xiangfangensis TaxID=1296537 RepID=UPI003D16F355
MKNKKFMLFTAIALLAFIGFAGKQYADNLIKWGGEENISIINSNLDTLNDSLTNKEQKISQVSDELTNTKAQLNQKQKDIEDYKQELETLKMKKIS